MTDHLTWWDLRPALKVLFQQMAVMMLLTMVELMLDAKGAGTGTMTGAARVKPTPDGGLVVDVFEVAPVQLTVHRVAEK